MKNVSNNSVSSLSHQAYLSFCVFALAEERRWPLKLPWCPPDFLAQWSGSPARSHTHSHSHTRMVESETRSFESENGGEKKKNTKRCWEGSNEESSLSPKLPFIFTPATWAVRRAIGVGVKHACLCWVLNFDAHAPQPPPFPCFPALKCEPASWALLCKSYFVPVEHLD